MASEGPRYPGTVATVAGSAGENSDNWVNPGNISADDGTQATITAASYDAGDQSFRLIGRNFGFTIPAGATIDGLIVEIDRRCFAGAASDFRVQIFDQLGGTFRGDNKAAAATAWPATLAIATYGAANDLWNAAAFLTQAFVTSAGFGIGLSVDADAANTDIGVDFIRMTIHYTAAAGGGTPNTWFYRQTSQGAHFG